LRRLRSRRLWPTRLQNSRYSNHLMGAPYIGAPISFNLRCSPGRHSGAATRRHSGAAPHVVILAQPHTSSFWRSPHESRHSGAARISVLALALACSRPCPCLFSPLPLPVLALAVVCSRPCRCQFSPLPLSVLRREQGASQAAEKPLFCLSEGAGGFSPLNKANGFKGL